MKRKLQGRIIVVLGFVMILINALGYLLNWHANFVTFGILGLVFVAVGLNLSKEKNKSK